MCDRTTLINQTSGSEQAGRWLEMRSPPKVSAGNRMGILKNARHEAFALGLADGKSQEQAYIDAGFAPKNARTGASKLLRQSPNILQRRDQVIAERERARMWAERKVAESTERERVYTRDMAMEEADLAIQIAVKMGKPGDIIAAVRFKADLFRLIVKQTETGGTGEFALPTDPKERKELLERIREERSQRGAQPRGGEEGRMTAPSAGCARQLTGPINRMCLPECLGPASVTPSVTRSTDRRRKWEVDNPDKHRKQTAARMRKRRANPESKE